jgi:uncharacterized Tic20 family protein
MLLSKGEEAMGQPNVTDEERLWAMLAHLLALLGYVVWLGAYIAPLVIYLVYKDKSQFVAFHALQSLFFQLALLVVVAICVLLAITIVLACIAIPLGIVASVEALMQQSHHCGIERHSKSSPLYASAIAPLWD